jgi:hypothetical protein
MTISRSENSRWKNVGMWMRTKLFLILHISFLFNSFDPLQHSWSDFSSGLAHSWWCRREAYIIILWSMEFYGISKSNLFWLSRLNLPSNNHSVLNLVCEFAYRCLLRKEWETRISCVQKIVFLLRYYPIIRNNDVKKGRTTFLTSNIERRGYNKAHVVEPSVD